MTPDLDHHTALAALDWQIELGADECIGDVPVNRYEVEAAAKQPKLKTGPTSNIAPIAEIPVLPVQDSAADIARILAGRCGTLEALRDAMAVFDHCALKQGARNLVFCDGNPAARVMVIGEAPGRDEDRIGKPFVGRAGQLLDKMFAAIEMGREGEGDAALYITNVMPWRPPQNRDPEPEEIAMMLPFLARHIALADPEVIVVMGNIACQALLGRKGITRLRGNWTEAFGKPVLPMFHPAALLRDGLKKRDSWHDLLALKARLG
ncbi:MAG: uracil-DNA glycosylase [Rhodobacteraceae bacterium]|nr:uracil-DNA glycosylase [Paracoccaceae bacterium]